MKNLLQFIIYKKIYLEINITQLRSKKIKIQKNVRKLLTKLKIGYKIRTIKTNNNSKKQKGGKKMSIFGRKGNVITYTVNKAVNTNMYITVQNGEVVVNAPWYFTANKIQQIVQEKKNWILSKMQEYEEDLSNMQSVKIFGKNYDVQVEYQKIKTPELNLKENYKKQIV